MLLGYRKVFMMKLLTITVPSYNSEAYLDRCMATLLPGGDEVEILIVDDGSTDRTAEIADEYERKYPNIVRAIHKENGGHGDAVTTGIRNATGLFFKVVDSDDSLAPEAYKQVLDFLRRIVKKNHELDMLISNFVYDRHDENGDVLRQKSIDYRKTLPRGRFFSWKEIGKFQTGHYLLMHAVIYRTSLLKGINLTLPKHTFYVDNIYVYKPFPYVRVMYYLDVDFYMYYTGREDQSVNQQVMMKRIDQQDRVNRIIFGAFDLEKISNKKLRSYLYSYLQIMCTVTTVHYALINTEDSKQKKEALWSYMKKENQTMWRHLRFSAQGIALNLPGKVGRAIVCRGYGLAQRFFGLVNNFFGKESIIKTLLFCGMKFYDTKRTACAILVVSSGREI